MLVGIPLRPDRSIGAHRPDVRRKIPESHAIGYFNRQIAAGIERSGALFRTYSVQMRPVAMTCIVASVGLLPSALSSGTAAQRR
jgi:hypothetical protein